LDVLQTHHPSANDPVTEQLVSFNFHPISVDRYSSSGMATQGDTSDRIYFKQLLAGRDFAKTDQMASQMVNFVYLVGDLDSREVVIIDPAYAVKELLDIAITDDMTVVGALATHYHADHVGGTMMGMNIEGAAALLGEITIPFHVQTDEAPWITRTTGLSASDMVLHVSGDVVSIGNIDITLVHTPGHTPGSQCFLVDNKLIAGDTLFLEGCGRTDLPGSNPEHMYESLQKLASLDEHIVIFPGHQYSAYSSMALGEVRTTNYVFKPKTKAGWMEWFGGA
jgi:glyoxylase-like metal-dependent hydrolase (beta-lactamase superfamily II)